MAETEVKKSLPPYVSYKSFSRFIKGLQSGHLPSRIDKAVLTGMSGSVQSAMTNSLEYLQLIEAGGRPTKALEDLAGATGPEYSEKLKGIVESSYGFLFDDGLELSRATTGQIQEAFRRQGANSSTGIKAIAFFLAAAKDAGITISKYVKTPSSPKPQAARKAAQRAAEEDESSDEQGDAGQPSNNMPNNIDPALAGLLMRLPEPGETMSKKDRDRFLSAFSAVLAVLYPEDDDLV